MGHSTEELLATGPFELVHPDDQAAALRALRTRIENSTQPQLLEFRVRRADGSWCTVEVIGTNRLADPVVRGIILNGRDITARKQS